MNIKSHVCEFDSETSMKTIIEIFHVLLLENLIKFHLISYLISYRFI